MSDDQDRISQTTEIGVGDWISFMSSGAILIGEVRYIKPIFGGDRQLYTFAGTVSEKCVLEVRHAEK